MTRWVGGAGTVTLAGMADELTPATFSGALGTIFEVLLPAGPTGVELHLAQLVEHAPSPGAPRAQPFSLIFVGPAGQHMPQATYTLRHGALGELGVFLVPIGPAPDGRHQYEAAFN